MQFDEAMYDASMPLDQLTDELDAGINPDDVLVVRETRAMRIVGFILCCFLEVPACILLVAVSLDPKGDRSPILFLLVLVSFFGIGAIVLMKDIIFGTYRYLALTDRVLIIRSGTARLKRIPLSHVERFDSRNGVLFAFLTEGRRRVKLIKSSYAPEQLGTLAERLTAWSSVPTTVRKEAMAQVDVRGILDRRRKGNRLILAGMATAVLCSVVVAAAVFVPRAGAIFAFQVMGACFGGFMAIGQILAGIAMRWTARGQADIASQADFASD